LNFFGFDARETLLTASTEKTRQSKDSFKAIGPGHIL
jgi:hypothetical protein